MTELNLLDKIFNQINNYAVKNSTCNKVNVGSLIFTKNKVLYGCNHSDDYNCKKEGKCYKAEVTGIYESCEETRKFCKATHSEIDVLNKLKEEFPDEKDLILLVTRYPCYSCSKAIVESGQIYKVIYCGRESVSKESEELFHNNGIAIIHYKDIDFEF